jgi:hypothetical protein
MSIDLIVTLGILVAFFTVSATIAGIGLRYLWRVAERPKRLKIAVAQSNATLSKSEQNLGIATR